MLAQGPQFGPFKYLRSVTVTAPCIPGFTALRFQLAEDVAHDRHGALIIREPEDPSLPDTVQHQPAFRAQPNVNFTANLPTSCKTGQPVLGGLRLKAQVMPLAHERLVTDRAYPA